MIDPPPPLYAPGEEASYDDGDVEELLVSFNSMEEMMNASTPSPFYGWYKVRYGYTSNGAPRFWYLWFLKDHL